MKKRKLFDGEGRLFGVVSAVDILALLAVAALGLMLYMRFFSTGEDNPNVSGSSVTANAKVECVLLVSGVRIESVNAIEVGDDIYVPDTSTKMGRVTAKRTEPYTQLNNTLDGRVLEMPVEGVYNLYLTVEGEGTVTDGQCFLKGSSVLSKNMTLPLETRYVLFTSTLKAFSYEVAK